MGEICPVCGLPKEICTCDQVAREEQKIHVYEKQAKGRKYMTIIEGFDSSFDIQKLAKELKQELACGGTTRKGVIELQGQHKQKVKAALIKRGFKESQIDVY